MIHATKIRIFTKTGVLLVSLILLLLIISCHNKINTKAERKNLIPEKELVSILTDVYTANGLLSQPSISEKFALRDSVSNYIDIIEKHGFSYDDMNRTIKYYFIKNPKKLVNINDQALAILSEMELRYEKESNEAQQRPKSIWPGKPFYELPDTSLKAGPEFSITLNPQTRYSFEFSITIYPDDQTVNPCFIAWYCNADSTETGKRTYLPAIKFFKYGQPLSFKISENIMSTYPVELNGSLLDFENSPCPAGIHAKISNIYFSIGSIL